jgi:Dinucleotide-utilizing enzymes involved in molybdopterin and thiamine biosynthesis family 2
MIDFTDEMLERYSRHILLKEVGVEGQEKILNSRVLIIGAGGLGSPAAMYLAAAGVGTIGIADADVVDLSNLQRQIIHGTHDVGKPKVVSASETMAELNPGVKVNAYRLFVDSSNIEELVKDYDFIIDGVDNFPAKYLINDACVKRGKPFSHAGIIQFMGQTTTFLPGRPCFRCIFPVMPPAGATPTCRSAGVLGVMAGIIGTIQAAEALKYILGVGENLAGKLLTFDSLTMTFRKIDIKKRKGCVCSDPENIELIDYLAPVCDLKESKKGK